MVLLEDGERDSIVVQVKYFSTKVPFLHSFCQVPPPAPSEVKEESSAGVKMEERRGVEVEGMKREREEEQDPREFAKRQRLEEGEIVPEEGDGFSDSEVEQTLQGAVPGFGHLQGAFINLSIRVYFHFRDDKFGIILLARLLVANYTGGDPRTRRSYVFRK